MIMKSNTISKVLTSLCLAATVFYTSCTPDGEEGDLGLKPMPDDVAFTVAHDEDNPNIVHFENTSKGFISIWDFGNGATARGESATAAYPVQGEYTVKLTILTSGGSTSTTKIVTIDETNPLMLDIPVYNFLTGGADALDGKTWVMDKETQGHMGIGPASAQTADWWKAGPNEKNGKNIYDDEFTFKLDGFSYVPVTNGMVYVNGGYPTVFPGSTLETGGGADFFGPYNPPAGLHWSLTEATPGKWILTFTDNAFIGYYVGSTSYEILSINENELSIRQIQGNNAGNAWYQKFIRKGYTHPVDPPDYKIEDMHDNFDGGGNLTYVGDGGGSLVTYDNPAPVPINTSAKVGKYVKANGAGAAFANVQIRKSFKFDLTERHVFKLKVFIPSYNDYTTAAQEGWQSYSTLQKMVAVKLQNSGMGGNAWQTQAEIKFDNLEMNKWLELTFDFSAYSAREDFDQIVIQIGGEAIHTGGVFFIDDFELLPAED